MSTHYEWVIEQMDRTDPDNPEILDVNHAATYAEALAFVDGDPAYDIGLVRDWDRASDGNHTRSWAYVEDGVLPEYLEDAFGRKLAKVPKAYRAQFDKATK